MKLYPNLEEVVFNFARSCITVEEYPIYLPMEYSLISEYTKSLRAVKVDYNFKGILNDYHIIYELPKKNIPSLVFYVD